jgi:putative addiction module killer protein
MQEKIQIYLYMYEEDAPESPYQEWEESLPLSQQAMMWSRLERIRLGNFGDVKKLQGVGKSLYELRIHSSPGWRIYFGKEGNSIIILLCGGNKNSQKRDITKAQKYWQDYQNTKSLKKRGSHA